MMEANFRLDDDKEIDAVTDLLYRRCAEFQEAAYREDGPAAVAAARLLLTNIYSFLNLTKE